MWPLAMLKRMCAAAGAALLRRYQRQVDRVGDEVGVEQQPLLLALVGEVVRLAVEALLEVVAACRRRSSESPNALMITGALVTAT